MFTKYKISLVAAISANKALGKNNQLLWHLPDDLKFFRQLTLHKPVVMGRKTFESIGKPLPNRHNIVLSRTTQSVREVDFIQKPEELDCLLTPGDEVMVIGGAEIYRLFLPEAHTLYLTEVKAQIAGDVFFPEFDQRHWQELERRHHPADDRHAYAFDFVTYRRLMVT